MNILQNKKSTLIFLAVFLLFAFIFLSFKITEVPPGINGDEAAIGYNAALVSKEGHDQNGRFLPLFVSAFNLTDWKQPVTFYSTVLAFKLFGISYEILRDVSVVIILISAVLLFFLSKEILGDIGAMVSIFIFITIPAVLIQSHLALENIAPIPFTILWLLMLSKYKKNFQPKYIFLSAIFLGIGLFTYPGMRLIFPVFSILSLGFIFYLNRKKRIKKILAENFKFLIVVSIFPIFLYSLKSQYPGAILAYNRPHIQTSYQELVMPYISTFDPSFLFLTGDTTPYHSTGKQGVFLLSSLPLLILGIVRIIRKKDLMLTFILITFFTSPLFYGLVGTIHRGSRLLVLLPPFSVIATLGVLTVIEMRNKLLKDIFASIVIFIILLNYIDFVRDYWYEYPKRVTSVFSRPIHKVFEKLSKESKDKNLKSLVQGNLFTQNPIAFNFFEQVYFPNKLEVWNEGEKLSKNIILLTDNKNLKIQNLNLKPSEIDDLGFYLLISK